MKRFRKLFCLDVTSVGTQKSLRRRKESCSQASYESLEQRQLLAAITWTSGDITGDNVVSTNGTSVFAISGSAGSGSQTVNGVNFVHAARGVASGVAQNQSPGNESLVTTIQNDNTESFESGGLGAVGEIIGGGWWGASTGSTATLTLTGLAVGDLYEVQIFSSDARGDRDQGFVTSLGDGLGGTGVDLQLNNQPNGSPAGDFGIGTFTADATTQTIELAGVLDGAANGGRVQVNAIQLRLVEPPMLLQGAVPVINEFSASNAGIIDDDNGNATDWIEIYNAGEDAVDLSGYTLTDDPTNIAKYIFPETLLAGGQYLIIFAGDDADPTSGTDLYTEFGLSSSGEYLGFYDPAGNVVSEFGVNGTDYPAQFQDVSYGLVNDGDFDSVAFFATPTPGSANVDSVDGVIQALPTVSVERGFYEQAFAVDITSPALGASIVYTTDGSEPSLTNGTRVDPANPNSLVQFSLLIDETTSLRTAAVRDGFVTRGSTTHTYVFLNDVISSDVLSTTITNQYSNQELRDGLLSIPTLSFNYDTEINDSFDPEQPASVEWLAPDGSEGFQIDAGISAFGGFFTTFEKKSFRIEFRSEYGASQLEFPLFEGFDNGIPASESFDSLDFRSGSHDRTQRGFGLSNRFVDDTLLEAGHAVPHGRYVHIYNNGVYWGQYHMRERWDADFLSQYYGGDEDDYEAVNGNVNNGNPTPNGWGFGEVYDGTGEAWENITTLADQDGSGNPTGGYQQLKEVVNLPQYIDYMLIYMAGSSENEYRSGGSIDGSVPYTFTLNDADGWLRGTGDRTDNAGPSNILGTLVDEADPEFMALYADRIQNMFGEGGVLGEERATARLQERLDEMELSFVLESARWNSIGEARTPQSFDAAANAALTNMLPNVGPTMIANFRARGLFPSADAPAFDINGVFQNGGAIAAGDILTLDATETVYFTTDGTDPRLVGGGISPNAILYDPSTSVSSVIPLGSEWRYLDDGSNQGTAWRSPTFNDSSWASGGGELGYGDNDEETTVSFGGNASFKHITTYFRHDFTIDESFDSAELELTYDDGAVVYLNGNLVDVVNFSQSVNQINYLTAAQGAPGDNAKITFDDIAGLLVQGSNTLAIEIHQASRTSSDISFDVKLDLFTELNNPAAISLTTSTNVQARTFENGEWSAVRDATFVIPAAQSDLRISEIQFNPADPSVAEIAAGFDNNDDFEFIELFNPNIASSINLNGVQLANGVEFDFGDFDLLPGERVVVVEDIDAFMTRYGDSSTVLGQWSGGLSNSGESIDLLDSEMNEIMSVNYGDGDPWYNAADGLGFSLVLEDPANTPVEALGKYYSWRSSTLLGGTPGAAAVDRSGVVVNEVLAHTDLPQSDSIELFNPTGAAINVGGWYLSDAGDDLQKYQIPAGTVISAGGYLVFDESDFNVSATGFALSGSTGDQVYLSQSVGDFVALQDAVEFGATFNGQSVGRLPNGTGRLTRLAANSFGSANGEAEVGPLVISEVNYHPESPSAAALGIDLTLTDNDLEYIEVANPTSATIDLTDWRIRGEADFDFAPGTSLAAGEAIIVVSFDPTDSLNVNKLAAFLTHYDIDAGVTIVGGLSGSLSNSSGRIALQQPDTPDLLGVIPHVVVDEVIYDDLLPWPDADGTGQSLHRDDLNSNGSFASNWIAATPTPGAFESEFLLGDVNQDGLVNFLDISPFISLLGSGGFLAEADVDGSGDVDFLDISPFITLLSSQ